MWFINSSWTSVDRVAKLPNRISFPKNLNKRSCLSPRWVPLYKSKFISLGPVVEKSNATLWNQLVMTPGSKVTFVSPVLWWHCDFSILDVGCFRFILNVCALYLFIFKSMLAYSIQACLAPLHYTYFMVGRDGMLCLHQENYTDWLQEGSEI